MRRICYKIQKKGTKLHAKQRIDTCMYIKLMLLARTDEKGGRVFSFYLARCITWLCNWVTNVSRRVCMYLFLVYSWKKRRWFKINGEIFIWMLYTFFRIIFVKFAYSINFFLAFSWYHICIVYCMILIALIKYQISVT